MSASITNRVILPDGTKIYLSDDQHGDARAGELYEKYGNLTMESCYKDQEGAKSLDDLTPFWSGTIWEQYNGNMPEFVQLVSEASGVKTAPLQNSEPDLENAVHFGYGYGRPEACEFMDDTCADDGILWGVFDFGSPVFCHNHYFPQEQLGYTFVEEGETK